eukprot:47540_1
MALQVHDGNERPEERSAVLDSNDLMNNLYTHPDLTNDIKQTLNAYCKALTGTLNDKTLENNSLRDAIRVLKAKQNDHQQSNILEQGINAYIQKRTKDMDQSLHKAIKERDAMYKQLEEEKRAHEASRERIALYKSQNDALTTLIHQLKARTKRKMNGINPEPDVLQPMYDDLKAKLIECDAHVSDKLDAICDAISRPKHTRKTHSLWKDDLDELDQIYKGLKQHNGTVKSMHTNGVGMPNELKTLRTQCDELKRQNQEHEKRIKQLQTELDTKEYDILFEKIDYKTSRLERINEHVSTDDNARFDEGNDELEMKMISTEGTVHTLDELEYENDELLVQISDLESANRKLKRQLKVKQSEWNALETRYNDVSREKKAMEVKYNALSRKALLVLCAIIFYFVFKYGIESRKYQHWWTLMLLRMRKGIGIKKLN